MKKAIIGLALMTIAVLAMYAQSAVVPALGLYWMFGSDPTAAGGIQAPNNQLLIRTDAPSLYYKSGTGATDWTRLGAGGSPTGTGTNNTVTRWTGTGTTLGNASILDDGSVATVGNFEGTIESIATTGTINDQVIGTTTSILRLAPSGATTITGFAGGADGRIIYVFNSSASNTIAFNHEAAGSTAANRLRMINGQNWGSIPNRSSVSFIYDGTDSRWQQITSATTVYPNFTSVGALIGQSTLTLSSTATLGDNTTSDSHVINGRSVLNNSSSIDSWSVDYTGTAQTSDLSTIDSDMAGTFNTTAANRTSYAINAVNSATESVGGNVLTNVALYGSSSGGDINYSGYFNAGSFQVVGVADFDNSLAVDGNTTFGNSQSADACTVNGTFTQASTQDTSAASFLKNGTGLTIDQTSSVLAQDTGTYNTTAGAITTYTGSFLATATRSAGANNLINVALRADATGGQTNYAAIFPNGNVGIGTSTPGGKLVVTGGNVQLSSDNAHFVTTWGHRMVDGTVPTLGTCGTGPTVDGTDVAGRFVTGTGATACTVTFSRTWTKAPACVVTAENGTASPYTISATAFTLSAVTASAAYQYHCLCVGNTCT